jgi:hypothetical protein
MDSTKAAPAWRVRPTEVREWNHGLRWSLEAQRDHVTTIVVADSTRDGSLIDLQSGNYAGTSGDAELDVEVCWLIAATVSQHTVSQQLDAIHGKRYGRSDRLRVA